MAPSVFCIAKDSARAVRIVSTLKTAGFSNSSISLLLADQTGTNAPEGAAARVGTGAAMGGVLGWLAAAGSLSVPGLGPFIAAGPLLAALSGAAMGATASGVTGALLGMGIPEREANRYEDKLKGGHILLAVHSDIAEEVTLAKQIFKHIEATDITTSDEDEQPARDDRHPSISSRCDEALG